MKRKTRISRIVPKQEPTRCDDVWLGISRNLCVLGFVLLTTPVVAQDVQIQVARGPYYVGEPFEVQVIARDFEEQPPPEISAGPLPGGHLRFVGVSPSTSTSISFINGKISRVREVTFVYRYEMTGTREGRIRVSPFTVAQASTSRNTESFDLEIRGIPETNNVEIELELPKGPVFVGQKVKVAIEFRIDRQTQRDLVSYQIHVPLFESSGLRFLDEPTLRTDTHLEVQTEAGVLRLPAVSSERLIRGRPTLIVRAERTMIAISPDEIRAEAPKVFISQGVDFRRDLFNQRRPTSIEKFMTAGRPIRIEVVEVPRVGRPASFAGAVGAGFSLEVDADRSVVQLGEPIMLSFHLRGNGDLSSASLPPLDAEGLFDPIRFRLPEESPAGIVDEDGKHFEVTLRVLDAGVREIPALAYSWFDAETRRFETIWSQPIALAVGAAEIIGADAVARRNSETSKRESLEDPVQAAPRPPRLPGDGTERSTKLSLMGANLAVDRDLTRLLRDQRSQGQNLAVTLPLYGAGVAFLALAAVMARRRAVDPRLIERARALARAERAMRKAFASSDGNGAAALGRALRELVAALPNEANEEFDPLIAECDRLRFAPTSKAGGQRAEGGPAIPPDLEESARRLIADRMKLDGDSLEKS